MAPYPQALTTILNVGILPSHISSALLASTSLPTTEVSPTSTHDISTCHESTFPSIKNPDQSFLSTTTFGVLSVVIGFGSLVVAVVGVMQYRQFKRNKAAKATAAAVSQSTASIPSNDTTPIYELQTGILHTQSSGSLGSTSVSTEYYNAPSTPPSPVLLPTELAGTNATAISTSSTTAIQPMATVLAVVEEDDIAESTATTTTTTKQTLTRPVHYLRNRSSSRFAMNGTVGFGGCMRTFTY